MTPQNWDNPPSAANQGIPTTPEPPLPPYIPGGPINGGGVGSMGGSGGATTTSTETRTGGDSSGSGSGSAGSGNGNIGSGGGSVSASGPGGNVTATNSGTGGGTIVYPTLPPTLPSRIETGGIKGPKEDTVTGAPKTTPQTPGFVEKSPVPPDQVTTPDVPNTTTRVEIPVQIPTAGISPPISGASTDHYELLAIVAALKPLEVLNRIYEELHAMRTNAEKLQDKANFYLDNQKKHAESYLAKMNAATVDTKPFSAVPPGTRIFENEEGSRVFVTPNAVVVVGFGGDISAIGSDGIEQHPALTDNSFTVGGFKYTVGSGSKISTTVGDLATSIVGLPTTIPVTTVATERYKIVFSDGTELIACLRRGTLTFLNPNGSLAIIGQDRIEGFGTLVESRFIDTATRHITITSAIGGQHIVVLTAGGARITTADGTEFGLIFAQGVAAVSGTDSIIPINLTCEV